MRSCPRRDPTGKYNKQRNKQKPKSFKDKLATRDQGENYKGVFGTVPVFSVSVCMSYRTYGVSGTGIDLVLNLPKCPVPVLMLCRDYRSVRYRYESLYRYRRYRYPCRTELTEVSGNGIDVAPNLPKCPVPVLMYRFYRSVRYRY